MLYWLCTLLAWSALFTAVVGLRMPLPCDAWLLERLALYSRTAEPCTALGDSLVELLDLGLVFRLIIFFVYGAFCNSL